MNAEHPTSVKLERLAWTGVKAAFVVLVLTLVLNPATKGRSGLVTGGPETVLPARIRAGALHAVTAAMSGRMARLAVQPGEPVAAGQLLGEIVNPDIDGLIERATRRVELAERSLRGSASEAPVKQRKWLDEQHQAAAKNLRAAEQRVREFSTADAEKAAAKARANADRIASLLEQRLATAREAEEADRQAEAEARNLAQRREAGARLRQELEAAQSHLKMARLQMESAVPEAAGGNGYARLEYEEAVAARETLLARKQALRIVAPGSGTLLQAAVEQGGTVQEGAVLFQIADAAVLHFEVSAPASVARAVHQGDQVVVRVPTDPPTEQAARVAQVLLEPDPQQQTYLIRVTIPNPAPDRVLVGLEGAVGFSHR